MSKGIGIACPRQVVSLLRKEGWQGHNGWWIYDDHGHTWRCRWYEAVALAMNSRHAVLRRPRDQREPSPARCQKTIDMLEVAP